MRLLLASQRTGAASTLMQSLGRRHVRYVNDQYRHTGTLWEGRYTSCLVQDATYLLRCHRYIELNPVRAGIVADPADCRWSSHSYNALGKGDALIRPHPRSTAIATPKACTVSYLRFVLEAIDPDETDAIRRNLQRQHALENQRFRCAIERQLGRRAARRREQAGQPRPRHRPGTLHADPGFTGFRCHPGLH